MKVAFIIGNGFNYLIRDLVRNYPKDNIPKILNASTVDVAKRIEDITKLWEKFNTVFNNLKEHTKEHQLSDEELIRMIYAVLDFFSTIRGFEKILSKEIVNNLKVVFNDFILDQIKQIANEFREHQESEGYRAVKQLFPNFGVKFQEVIRKNNLQGLHIYTTNYDGVLDTLLTGNPKGFVFNDGFGFCSIQGLLELDPNGLFNQKQLIAHLHGSYRFQRYFGSTYKTKSNIENKDPVMVFNNPDMKEQIIRNDNVLSEYFHQFINDLKVFEKLIIFGNSMINEPHLKNQIKLHFNRDNTKLYICSRDPDAIVKRIEPSYNGSILSRNTKAVKSEDQLIEFIDDIIKD
ncbi:hypothetical protein Q0590_36405 [Rhodocytophaga aerolata]|uniref:SIR2-like domain-containing protein n=1 Tax=Rhodocytophaga aerolata TaxID=455078 RepID=A0ABT8RI88_9BACT|nr:hypothetical protein [Rhodocytophaga aerolata]MDO1451814.1 hypothetical protein [Rhodocytophaga aerolata]